jgi:Concanavalin A-like lectin/glucanases superfamily
MTRTSGVGAAALLGVVVLAACGGVAPDAEVGSDGGGSQVSVAPTAVTALVGSSVSFTANLSVTWTVDEGAVGGTITPAGVYTAPSTAGIFHVIASVASTSGKATVTVKPPGSTYDTVVLADRPVAFWSMSSTTATEPDLTGNGHAGTYKGGQPPRVGMPNGDPAVDFNGSSEYLTVPSSGAFSIPTTGNLTWEAWIRPDTLQFPSDSSDGYVDWMGKCESYSPTCEWEARMYSTSTAQGRPNRFSAYAFNPTAGLGSAADWQPASSLIVAGHWYHVVGEYTTLSQPSSCPSSSSYPGSLNIWVNGVLWSQSSHGPTGCMSQYSVRPVANGSPLVIGTMAMDTWFPGAIAKVAIYDHLLTQEQISNHYQVMTGRAPSGSCGATCTLTNP